MSAFDSTSCPHLCCSTWPHTVGEEEERTATSHLVEVHAHCSELWLTNTDKTGTGDTTGEIPCGLRKHKSVSTVRLLPFFEAVSFRDNSYWFTNCFKDYFNCIFTWLTAVNTYIYQKLNLFFFPCFLLPASPLKIAFICWSQLASLTKTKALLLPKNHICLCFPLLLLQVIIFAKK